MKAYINMEFTECLSDTTLHPSKEDQQFIKAMDEGMAIKEGHYQMPLPFCNDAVKMPNNESQAYICMPTI